MDKYDEGRACFRELWNPANLKNRLKYGRDLARYEEICQLYDGVQTEPLIKKRLALYFRGEYHLMGGERILAEEAYWKALNTWAPKETIGLITDAKIKFDILQIYYAQSSFRQAEPLLKELSDLLHSGRTDHGLCDDAVCDIYTMQCEIYESDLRDADLDAFKDMLDKVHRDILRLSPYELPDISQKRLVFAFAAMILLAERNYISQKERRRYREILDYVNENKEMLLPGPSQQMLMWDAREALF